jgi:hypothetical protein
MAAPGIKRILQLVILLVIPLLFTGCLTPVKNEVPLAGGDLSVKATSTNDTRLVIFNNSNFLLYGLDGSGRINVKLNGKGLVQLKVGYYAQAIVPKGSYQVELLHVDRDYYSSQHQIELSEPESFLEIRAVSFSNEAGLVSTLPPNFEKKFKPVK